MGSADVWGGHFMQITAAARACCALLCESPDLAAGTGESGMGVSLGDHFLH